MNRPMVASASDGCGGAKAASPRASYSRRQRSSRRDELTQRLVR